MSIERYQKEGVTYLSTCSKQDFEEMIQVADDAYFNTGCPIVTDYQYDVLCEHANLPSDKVGCLPTSRKVLLPFFMGSLNKIKTQRQWDLWKKKQLNKIFHLSPKLDGISVLVVKRNGCVRLYSRGDGIMGQELSTLFPHLIISFQNVAVENFVLRGELILSKSTFMTKYQGKGNARNIVSGIANTKNYDPIASQYVDLVSYEVFEPDCGKPSDQFRWMRQLKIPCVPFELVTLIDVDFLRKRFETIRSTFKYHIDGVVIVVDLPYERPPEKNPSYAIAFKSIVEDQIATTIVRQVLWNVSKDGLLKPKLRLDPVTIGGNRIEYVTAFNAKYIETHKLGEGAMVEIVRSGDVIPVIRAVMSGVTSPQFPDDDTWEWKGPDIVLKHQQDSDEMKEMRLVHFFKVLGIKGGGRAFAKTLVAHGIRQPLDAVHWNETQWIETLGEIRGSSFYKQVRQKIRDTDIVDILHALGVLERGISKKHLSTLFERFPTLDIEKIDKKQIQQLPGIGVKTSESIWKCLLSIHEIIHCLHSLRN